MTLVDLDPTAEHTDLVELLDVPERQPLLDRLAGREQCELLSAALIGAAPAMLLREILGWQGYLGTCVWWYLGFLVAYYLLQRSSASGEVGIDRVIAVVIWSVAIAVLGVLAWMLTYVAIKGASKLDVGFFYHDMVGVGALNAGGGARAAIVGSAEQIGIAVVVVVPVAVLTAVYLNEMGGRFADVVRFVVNALAGLPSIVAGLIVYSVWVAGHGFSGAAGSAALIVLMLPTVTRTSEEVLRIVPDPLREASLALGAPQWRVVTRVVLPTALAGLTTAVILGVALGIGETAPLLLTTSNSIATNYNPFHGPQSSLTLFIKSNIQTSSNVLKERGFTAALVLLVLVGLLFVAARYAAGRSARRLGRKL